MKYYRKKWWLEDGIGAKSWVIEEPAVTKRGPQRWLPAPHWARARGRDKAFLSAERTLEPHMEEKNYRDDYELNLDGCKRKESV